MLQRTNIYLEPETIQFYKKKAGQRGVSMAEELRTVLQKEKISSKKNPFNSLLQIANIAKKRKKKLPRDLAKNHDYYLYVEPYERRGSV